MTEYEMISALQGYVNIQMTILMNFFAVLTAYLVAGYLSAHQLSKAMASFVTWMFLVLSALFTFGVYRISLTSGALQFEMWQYAKAGRGLAWNPLASATQESIQLYGSVVSGGMIAIMLGGVLGSVYFFYDCRKRGLKTIQASST